MLAAVARLVQSLPPAAASAIRAELAEVVVPVATAVAPHLPHSSGPLELVQVMSALAALGVRPGPAFTAAHMRGIERVQVQLRPLMWLQLRNAYSALRLPASSSIARAFLVHAP